MTFKEFETLAFAAGRIMTFAAKLYRDRSTPDDTRDSEFESLNMMRALTQDIEDAVESLTPKGEEQ